MADWTRFRSDNSDLWLDYEPWPAGENANTVLVWNACDGYHVWSHGWYTPPGTHWCLPPAAPCVDQLAERISVIMVNAARTAAVIAFRQRGA